jgi:hypothetical protein
MRRQNSPLLHHLEHEIRVDGIARIAEPPARVAEPDLAHPVLDLEQPAVGGVAREQPLDTVIVRARTARDFQFRMPGQHLVMNPADPMPTRADLAVRHRVQVASERRAERLEHLLDRVERNAADQQELVTHVLPLQTVALHILGRSPLRPDHILLRAAQPS